jgi:hypothetical protein
VSAISAQSLCTESIEPYRTVKTVLKNSAGLSSLTWPAHHIQTLERASIVIRDFRLDDRSERPQQIKLITCIVIEFNNFSIAVNAIYDAIYDANYLIYPNA